MSSVIVVPCKAIWNGRTTVDADVHFNRDQIVCWHTANRSEGTTIITGTPGVVFTTDLDPADLRELIEGLDPLPPAASPIAGGPKK